MEGKGLTQNMFLMKAKMKTIIIKGDFNSENDLKQAFKAILERYEQGWSVSDISTSSCRIMSSINDKFSEEESDLRNYKLKEKIESGIRREMVGGKMYEIIPSSMNYESKNKKDE